MKKKNWFFSAGTIAWLSVTAFLLALLIAFTALCVPDTALYHPIMATVAGGKTPIYGDEGLDIYKKEYSSKSKAVEAGNELNVRIAEEGFTLLLNENNALPLEKGSKISVFGKNSVNLVLGGTGSGAGDSSGAATIFDGLEEGGFEYNKELREFYESSASGSGRSQSPALSGGSASAPTLEIGETPVSSYPKDVISSFSDYNDAALVVISRLGGESWDLPRFQSDDSSRHYLQLDKNEYSMLDMVTARFEKVVVVLNTLTSFQCDFISEYNNASQKRIDAVLWIGGPGKTGALAIGSLLNGDVNPSGRTTDIYSADFTADPTWQNFGDGSQTTADGGQNTAFEGTSGQNMVMYEEGIYLGYRYYETRGYEELMANPSSHWYEDNVIFPFGYGLSYTKFSQSLTSEGELTDKNSTLTFKAQVENIGERSGKDTVQLYVTKPYIQGGIEKSFVELVDFAKTDVLETEGEGRTQTVTFTVNAYDLASYDYNDANKNGFCGYELDAGDYVFYISNGSHVAEDAYDSVTVTLQNGIQFPDDPVTGNAVENRFTTDDYFDSQYRLSEFDIEDAEGYTQTRKGMSRTDFARTFPTAPTREERMIKADELNGMSEQSALESYAHNNTNLEQMVSELEEAVNDDAAGEEALMLRDLLNEENKVDFNDPRWNALLNRITFEDMLYLVNHGDFKTTEIEYIGKNLTNDSDGPVGFANFMAGLSAHYKNNITFVCEIVVGATWNKDLAYQMGKMVGENGLWGDAEGTGLPYTGWYAPAVNLHRSPFSGRNFEYYSEDPVLSGKLAVNVINGAAQKGVYTDVKHFALNDQETNRSGVATYCTEQAMRELYFKPFELAVKGADDPSQVKTALADGVQEYGGTTGMMSSFNRIGTRWTGGDYRLMTEILRDEWGFKGLVISDYKTEAFMDARQMLYAGNDLILVSTSDLMWNDADPDSPEDMAVLRTAVKNILYTVANSNSIQVDIDGYRTEWWVTLTYVLYGVVAAGSAVWGFFVIRKAIKRRR